MIFTLEALEARQGDALLLHWGDPADPRLIVIDGGPRGVYRRSVKPRLEELRSAREDPDEPLPVEILMVSHVDDDHIAGVLDLAAELVDLDEQQRPLPWDVLTLWHNSFDDILGNQGEELLAALSAALGPVVASGVVPAGLPIHREAALVLANVRQGRVLRQSAEKLSLLVNDPFVHPADLERPGLVRATAGEPAKIELDGGLTLTVIGPTQDRLEALQQQWDEELPAILAKERAAQEEAAAAAFDDDSVPNLSSIVVLAEADGRKMLLTGDARGDFVLESLEATGLLEPGGALELDLLKMPHHGSFHNIEDVFFERLPAQHYVISANGQHGNPDLPTLEMLSAARGDAEFTLWLTNREPRLEEFFAAERERGKRYQVIFRDDDSRSVKVELGEALGR
jgi:hypothetical protein